MMYSIKRVTIDDYDAIYELWNSTEQSKRALNPVDDSCEGIARYLKRNPDTCFVADRDGEIVGVILAGHDGRRGFIHHLAVREDCRRQGIGERLVARGLEALKAALADAGMGDILAEVQAQYDAWKAAQ